MPARPNIPVVTIQDADGEHHLHVESWETSREFGAYPRMSFSGLVTQDADGATRINCGPLLASATLTELLAAIQERLAT